MAKNGSKGDKGEQGTDGIKGVKGAKGDVFPDLGMIMTNTRISYFLCGGNLQVHECINH